ncbi:hypothetical protein [Bacillus zhangzhouensis]|uniref:Uncharacterized protein n=1 Tax=Bacillus zhangzhouensis TaxID=1178540 RepID=A0A081L9B4_9BACI|nr:hypothetical protein [Bacillus zhangzhouensis]KEP25840.1 hypothetical protein BA70_05660 [Bacillus zhangzhouensis]
MHKNKIIDAEYGGKEVKKTLTIDMLHQLLSEHYPTLKDEHWDVDVDTIRASPILHPLLKRKLPIGVEKFTCVLFTQQTASFGDPLIVYFLLDEKGESFYAMDLLLEQNCAH